MSFDPSQKYKKTILLIEDEDSLAEIIADELTSAGYKVGKARNGLEGLDMINSLQPDLIICDRAMPAMTGDELLERLRGIYPQYRDIPFIFLTALTSAEDKDAVRHLTPAAYLDKPLDLDTLLETVKTHMT